MQFFRISPFIMQKKWLWTQVPIDDINQYSRENLLKPGVVVRAEYDYGRIAGDFLGNSCILTIVSPKVADILTRFSSVQTYKVELVGFDAPFEYVGIVINSQGHKLNIAKSKADYDSINDYVSDIDGMYFDDWNGDDIIFVREISKVFLVSERVVKLLKEANVTNCRYTPLEEYRSGIYFRKGSNY